MTSISRKTRFAAGAALTVALVGMAAAPAWAAPAPAQSGSTIQALLAPPPSQSTATAPSPLVHGNPAYQYAIKHAGTVSATIPGVGTLGTIGTITGGSLTGNAYQGTYSGSIAVSTNVFGHHRTPTWNLTDVTVTRYTMTGNVTVTVDGTPVNIPLVLTSSGNGEYTGSFGLAGTTIGLTDLTLAPIGTSAA